MADEEKFSGVQTKDADLAAVLLQVKKNIMKSINVASVALVKKIDTTHQMATVQIYPLLEGEAEKNIDCFYLANLEEELATGDGVLVLFCDRNFLAALKKLKSGQKPSTLKENIDLHSDRYGIIIGKLFSED